MRARRPIPTLLAVTATTIAAAACGDTGSKHVDDAFEVERGVVKGGVRALRVARGDAVKVTIRSDVREEVHLHGIELEATVGPNRTGELEFVARHQGGYELELHESGLVLGAVVVS